MVIAVNKWFNYLIMLIILLNAICMALFDYHSENKCAYLTKKSTCEDDSPEELKSVFNQRLNLISTIFGFLFTIEAMIKIVALGFVNGK